MKTIEQIKSEVLAKWPDARCVECPDGQRVFWDGAHNSTFAKATESLAWEQAHKYMGLNDLGVAPGMKPETLALIQAEIEHIDQFLSLPSESESYRQVHIAMKNQRVFIDKLLKSERQR